MSNVSKTNAELIAEVDRWVSSLDSQHASSLVRDLRDALESATRVPEQGEASAALVRRALEGLEQLDLNGPTVRDGTAWGSILREAKADLTAALDGAPEPDWEYAWAGTDELGDDWIGDAVFDSVAEARTFFNHSTWVRTQSGELVRRRKAGPWEQIKGESE